jgi:uncharacterized protein YjcR
MAYTEETRAAAKMLYLRRHTPQEIKEELGLGSVRVVYLWAEKYGWTAQLSEEAIEDVIERRYKALAEKSHKTQADLDELNRLIDHHVLLREKSLSWAEREAAIKAQAAGDVDSSAPSARGPRARRGEKGAKKGGGKLRKNDISQLVPEDFDDWLATLFGYQLRVREAKNDPAIPRTRNILKSRQVGMTYYFAGEAFEDAVFSGENQIFLSATKAQAEIFRSYIIKIAWRFLGVELSGNPIVLSNGAELHFLSTSAASAQSRNGHVYIDEYFWIRGFETVTDVASACATHKHLRRTWFSTPSSKAHGGYRFWTGERWKGTKPSRQALDFPDVEALRDGGRVCPDNQWRYIITLEDAIALGCNLIDIEELQGEYPEEVFDRLYMCMFIDDELSVFKFQHMERAAVDISAWTDFDENAVQPFGRREVWLGYDPSRTRDNACLVVVAPPLFEGERFRVLKKVYWRGMNFRWQAQEIEKIAKQYHVTHLGVDVSGLGKGVYDLLQPVFKSVITPINYSLESKTALVLKMVDVVESDRIHWDETERDIALAFMTIKRSTTGSGQVTYRASRDSLTGHADVFFALSHAISHEPLDTSRRRKSTWAMSHDTDLSRAA